MNEEEENKKLKEGLREMMDPQHQMSDAEGDIVYKNAIANYKARQARGAVVSQTKQLFKIPLFGAFFAGCISMASGNGIGWIVLHALANWFYVAYKFAFLFFGAQ